MRTASIVVAVAGIFFTFAGAAQAALRAPGVQAPAANASVESLPTFTWRAVKGAAQYEFQLSADSKFGAIVLGKGRGRGSQVVRNTAATLHKSVPDGKYFWRVRAISKAGRAGSWSKARTLTKAWKATPKLVAPTDELSVAWPSLPLLLRWTPVPHATHYLVSIGTDPSLAQSVPTGNRSLETQATVFALQGTLPAGRYYWAITPIDAEGHRGTRSRVGAFTWQWPTATATRFYDLNDSLAVVDPLLDWDLIPGAARYEVEINPDDDFAAGSRVCCKDPVLGTSLSPARILPNNNDVGGISGYHWRVRAFDADGNPGQWNHGPTFEKFYDKSPPTVPNLNVETVVTTDATKASPLVTWDPVPGAMQYQVQWTDHAAGFCNWTAASGPIKTSALAWTPLSPTGATGVPGGIGITTTMRPNGTVLRSGQPFSAERAYPTPAVKPFIDGATYCVRVRALSDNSYRENDNAESQVISLWTQYGGVENAPAFTFDEPSNPATDPPPGPPLPAPAYQSPVGGQVVSRTPILRWSQVAGARRYFVLIARDSNFTNVIDAAFVASTVYVPNLVLEDEQTSYFWAVIPTSNSYGSNVSGGPLSYNPQSFRKLSNPPELREPAAGADAATQPRFRWTPTEAAQKYRLQISTDPQFGSTVEDVITASTSHTAQEPLPVDTALYWRVRAEQQQVLQTERERVELRWSATGSFRRRLPVPVPDGGNPTRDNLIPAFTWAPVSGAISYDVQLVESDGDSSDFTMKSAAFAPSRYTGTGILRYKVRANFATRSGKVASAYSSTQSFTRIIDPPTGARMNKSKGRLSFSWNAAQAGETYRVELSRTDSFTKVIDTVKTSNTSWAPDLQKPALRESGPLYWRLASVDADNNVGAFTSKRISAGKPMSVKLFGTVRRNATSTVRVRVRNGAGKALGGAKVRVAGAGARSLSKTTGRSGTVTFRVRPTKAGKVTFTVTKSGYAEKAPTLSVR